LPISRASAGLELPATSLTAPFLADIDASPRDVVDTTFNIPTPETSPILTEAVYQGVAKSGNTRLADSGVNPAFPA
jgi:hypothetical protein